MIHFHDVIRQLEAGHIGIGLSDLPDQWMKYLHVSDRKALTSQHPVETTNLILHDVD